MISAQQIGHAEESKSNDTVPLLAFENLVIEAIGEAGAARLVDSISFSIAPGEILGLVGESGCGKSVTAMSVLRLLPEPPLRIVSGSIRFNGSNLTRLSRREMREIRGGRIGMIFQEPMSSLNPTFTIGWQIIEALRLHTSLRRAQLRAKALEMLKLVGIGAPDRRIDQYPHELSGGLRQRAMIAMALACDPKLLIADEPTTALDATTQLQILELIARLRREFHMAVLLITHDLGVIANYADRVAVMYAGKVVEQGSVASVFEHPRHPYTAGLLAARPKLTGPRGTLATIPGTVPPPSERRAGCSFVKRCTYALSRCSGEIPPDTVIGERLTACWNPMP